MHVYRALSEISGRLSPSSVAIGNFDGVHLGHRALFDAAAAEAARIGAAKRVALTFEPHPARVLSPALAPRLLTPVDRKLELLAEAGLDAVVVQTFDPAFAGLTAAEFVGDYLLQGLGARAVVVGPDFSFGKGREGNVTRLRELLAPTSTLHVVPKVEIDGIAVSSTRVRELVLEGRVSAAARLLGRPYDLDGQVVSGFGRGRKLGWPTANVNCEGELLPAIGVYAVRASGPFGELPAAANLGRKPTFGEGQELTVEVHLIGYAGPELVGSRLRVKFLERLRSEMRFPSVEALAEQIAKDVAAAERIAG